ncbi:putative acetyltransferase [Crossiella equi]|uniref:Acetyltransferase n=1 Tax=Crossiella equi TaxID=130796 RepID=A0ABS5A9X7_9PSEU|nr:GNAT family N-acetyltransferase [Crossiella equi]MBP2473082.1 putative acetyltransferase [Crossiella equi]
MTVRLTPVAEPDKAVLANLIQLYLYDFTEFRPEPITPHGTYDYPYLDHYFTEPGREAHLVHHGPELAGFVLLRHLDDGWNVSEFFVLRPHRRRGVARTAARLAFARHPGPWTLCFDHGNPVAARFWRGILPGAREEDRYPPEFEVPQTKLRFTVS